MDEQFTVLTRIVITRMNDLISKHNEMVAFLSGSKVATLDERHEVEPLTYEAINETFLLFGKLRERPDFRDHLRAFYLGELKDMAAIDALPEPKAVETEVPEEVPSKKNGEGNGASVIASLNDEGELPDGAQVFGGNYGTEPEGEGSEEEAQQNPGEAHEVPPLHAPDGDENPPADTKEG